MYGPFEELTQSLVKGLGVAPPTSNDLVMVPCLSRHLPALLHYFPEAEHVKSVPGAAKAHAAIRTVSVPGYEFDVKFSLACQITSSLRVLPCWVAAAAPEMTAFMRKILPEDLWLFGEVATVTGSQEDKSEARYLTCILRENLEAKAQENDEALILVSALMEKPLGGQQTYAEILFNLNTTAEKKKWFTRFVYSKEFEGDSIQLTWGIAISNAFFASGWIRYCVIALHASSTARIPSLAFVASRRRSKDLQSGTWPE